MFLQIEASCSNEIVHLTKPNQKARSKLQVACELLFVLFLMFLKSSLIHILYINRSEHKWNFFYIT